MSVGPAFAWNHGGVSPDENTTFLGLTGPGVEHHGVKNDVFSDHADTRPTMLALLGLKDDYSHQGRFLAEIVRPRVLQVGDTGAFVRLARVWKRINSPTGELGLDSLAASTLAIAPIIVLGWFTQRQLVRGLTFGAVK